MLNIKKSGSLLIELMLSLTLSSFVMLTLYKTYSIINKNIFFINETSDLHIEKMKFLFHINEDLTGLIIPNNIINLYKAAINLKKNKEKKNFEEEEKKYKKLFNLLSVYFPKLEKENNNIIISWVTTRNLLNNNEKKLIRVEYLIEELKEKNIFNNDKIFSIKRSESDILNLNEKKTYVLINKIKNPIIYFIFPILNNEENKNNLDNNNNKYDKWKKNSKYEVFYEYSINEDNLLEKPIVPYKIFIDGDLIQTFDGKSLPLELSLSVLICDNALENLLNFENKIINKNNINEKNKQSENKKKNENENENEKLYNSDKKEDNVIISI